MNLAYSENFFVNRVAILGRPNAGKSTLLNALLESPLSGTSARPQTTRTNIRGILQKFGENNEWVGQIILADTPGVNLSKGLLERAMHMSVEEALKDVETVVWVADARTFAKDLRNVEMDRVGGDKIAGWLLNTLKACEDKNWILVISKMDLVNPNEVLPLLQKAYELLPQFKEIVPISAMGVARKSNLDTLVKVLEKYSQPSEPVYAPEVWTDMNQRQVLQNLIREAIFRQTKQEIPYKSDSTILSFVEPEGTKKMSEIHAYIWVSKASMKPLLVGKNGSRVRELNKAVRDRYEEITGDKVVLKLFVKVVEKWESRAANLSELGYVF